MRKAPALFRNWMAFILSSLFIMATGLPTSFMDWLMSSSSRSFTLSGMLSGSEAPASGEPVEMSGRRLPSMASKPVMS